MNTRKGVTLIELLVAMSILALLVVILQSVFAVSLRGWKKSDNLLQVTATARIVLERMSREISSAIVKPGNSFYCIGFDQASPSGWRTGNKGDEFYFIAPLNTGYADGSDLCEAGYWAGADEEGMPVLKRFYVTDDRKVDSASPKFDFNLKTGSNHEFASNIADVQFDFFDSSNIPHASWDSRISGGPPAKIKIIITVVSGKGTPATNPDCISKKFSTVVSLY
jgi:prepilin-type N-terminal cleavage/methylation domain-containing protein